MFIVFAPTALLQPLLVRFRLRAYELLSLVWFGLDRVLMHWLSLVSFGSTASVLLCLILFGIISGFRLSLALMY